MRVLTPPVAADLVAQVKRLSLPSAVDDRLYFAQVREDPRLEIEALEPGPDDSIVIVGSGGCTALSLLAAGAGHVTAVDVNRAQNHLDRAQARRARPCFHTRSRSRSSGRQPALGRRASLRTRTCARTSRPRRSRIGTRTARRLPRAC